MGETIMNYSSMSDEELLNIANGSSQQDNTKDYSSMSDDELLNIVNGSSGNQQPKPTIAQQPKPLSIQEQQKPVVQTTKPQVSQEPIVQNNEPSNTLVLQGSVKKITPYQWFRNNIRPAHFFGDLGKSTANAFREESIMGANAITGAKNWALDKIGLSKWHRPTEEIKAEREALIPKFKTNENARVANFVGDMLGWTPMFAVGGEGIAAVKGGAKAAQVANVAAKTGRTTEQAAKVLARREAINTAVKKAAEKEFLKNATVAQQIIRPQTITNAAKTANNAGMDMATFEGLRHGLRTLGGEEQENTFGQDVLQGYGMGAAFGGGASALGSVAKPVVKAIGNTEFIQNVANKSNEMLNSNDGISHFVANFQNALNIGRNPKNANINKYRNFEKLLQESGLPEEEISANLLEYNKLSARDKIRVDKAVRKQLMELDRPSTEKPQFFGEEPTIQTKQPTLDDLVNTVNEDALAEQYFGKPITVNKLNKIEQAIDNGTPITKESIEGKNTGYEPNKPQYSPNPADDINLFEQARDYDVPQTDVGYAQTPVASKQPTLDLPKVKPNTKKTLADWKSKYSNKNTSVEKGSPVKSSEGINTHEKVETPQNEPSHLSQNEHSVKELPKKIIEPEKSLDDMNVTKLEAGEAEGANTSYSKINKKSIKESDALDNGLNEEVPNSGRFASENAEFNSWYDKYEKADADTRAKMLEEKANSFSKREEGLDFYNKFSEQIDRDKVAFDRNKPFGFKGLSKEYKPSVSENDLLDFASKLKNADSLPKIKSEKSVMREATNNTVTREVKSNYNAFLGKINNAHNLKTKKSVYEKIKDTLLKNESTKYDSRIFKDLEDAYNYSVSTFKNKHPFLKKISMDNTGNIINSNVYKQNIFGKIKAWQQKNNFVKDLKSRSEEMVKDLKEERFLNPSNKEIPPVLKKAKIVYEQIKKGEVEYNPEKAYHILTKGFDKNTINGKPIVTTIGDLTKNSVRYGKEFEGLEDVVLHIESGKNGLKGYHDPTSNEIHISDEETLFHEMQHYIQQNFSNLNVHQYAKLTEESNRLSERCETKAKFYDNKLKELKNKLKQIPNKSNYKEAKLLEKEIDRWTKSREKVIGTYYKRYKNCGLEKEAFEAGYNRKLNRASTLVNFVGGTNHAKGFIKSNRLLNLNKNIRGDNYKLQRNVEGRLGRHENEVNNTGSIGKRPRNVGVFKKSPEQPIGLKGIKEPNLKATKYQKYDKSTGLSPKEWVNEVKETKKNYGLTDSKARALVKRAANEIKTTSDETERLLIKRGIITEEQAANRKKMVGSSTYIADNPEYTSDGKIDLTRTYEDLKEGVTGKREHRTVKNIHLENAYKNTQSYNAQAKYMNSVMDYVEKEFAKPIENGRVLSGYKAVNSKLLSNAIFGRYSKQWYETIYDGSEAINKAFKDEKVAKAWEELHKRTNTPDMQIPEEVYNSLFSGKGESAADWISRYGSKHPFKSFGKLTSAVHDAMMEKFKQRVLTSASFVMNNRIGNQIMIAAKSDNPGEYIKSLYDAFKIKNSDLPAGVLESNINNEIKSFNIRKKYTGYAPLDNAFNLFGGQLLDTSTLKGMKKLDAKILNWFVGKPARGFAKFSDKVMRFNQKFEDFERRQVFAKHINKERRELVKRTGQKMITQQEFVDQINKNSPLREAIIEDIQNTLGDYNNFSKFEKDYLKRVVPFYSWYRTISRHTYQLAKKNPTRAALIMYELDDIKNNSQEDLKEYQRGSIKTGVKNELTGDNLVINKMHAMPYMTFREDLGVNPFIQVPAEAIRGKKFFQEQEISNERYARFYEGKEEKYYDTKTGKTLDKLPASTRLGYVGKQLLWNNAFPYFDNPMLDVNKTSGLFFNKFSKDNSKKDKGQWHMYDKSYDATVFGGFNIGDKVGTAKYKGKYGQDKEKEVVRSGKSRYRNRTALLNRGLGLSIQNENPSDYFSAKEEKESLSHKLSVARRVKAWRAKHKKK